MGDNWIYSYYQGIKDGTYHVGRWVRLVYEYLIKGLEDGLFFYDAKKANHAIDYIETRCFHTEGDLAPSPIRLEVWQKALLSAVFGTVDGECHRQFRELFLVEGRKNGKTKIASSIAKYMWMLEGGYGTRIFCVAPKLEQADLVYNDVWAMTQLDPDWIALKEEMSERDAHNKKIKDDSMLARHRQSDLAIPGTNSTVKKIASNSKKSDGFNPSLVILDEIGAWEGDKGLKQYEVMLSGMGTRRDGLAIACTTAGYVHDGIYDEMMKRSTRLLLGDSNEKRLLPILYMIDDIDKWNDINELRKANPQLGISIPVDYMLDQIAIAEGSLSKKAEFITKHCNIKQNSSLAWLDSQVIEAASGEHLDIEDFRGSYCVVGVDLSRTTDLTAGVVVIEKDGELYTFAKFWLPSERIEELQQMDGVPYQTYIERGILDPSGTNYIDYKDVYRWLTGLIEDRGLYPLVVGYDKYSATYLVSDLEAYGFKCDDVYQGYNLYPVMLELEGLLKDGKIHVGDNDLLKIHMYNSAVKLNQEKARGKLIKLAPTAHIDGMAALLDAMTVRQKWYPELGERLKNEG